jgi:hypothetical protein
MFGLEVFFKRRLGVVLDAADAALVEAVAVVAVEVLRQSHLRLEGLPDSVIQLLSTLTRARTVASCDYCFT